jgi:hypothetical protein
MSAELPLRQSSKEDDAAWPVAVGDALLWRATYTFEANGFKYTDEACIRDLSRTGCGIHGRTCLEVGSKTTVIFHLQDGQRPLSVASKVVWVTGKSFDVEFLRLSAGGYERMQQYAQQVLNDTVHDRVQASCFAKERRKPNLRLTSLLLLFFASLWGCATPSVPVPTPSAAFFVPTSEERATLASRASELDAVAADCAADDSCHEQVHFSRALVSVFENREAARLSFERVISLNPASPLANSSALWLEVLNNSAGGLTASSGPLVIDLTNLWLRQWMARPMTPPSIEARPLAVPRPALVQALHQQVRERDRRIAQLRAQLDALKVINQDQEDRRQIRQPRSLTPRLESGR